MYLLFQSLPNLYVLSNSYLQARYYEWLSEFGTSQLKVKHIFSYFTSENVEHRVFWFMVKHP